MWGVYDLGFGPREVHVAPMDVVHELYEPCFCDPKIEVGDDYFLVTHNEAEAKDGHEQRI